MIWKIVPLSPRHLHYKAIMTSLGVTADLSNTNKNHKEAAKTVRQKKKKTPNEIIGLISEKELNEMGASNLSDVEFKAMVI